MENKVKRVTKAQRFADIKALLHGEPVVTLEDGTPRTTLELADSFIDGEVALLARKNAADSKKQTELQEQNAALMEKIVDYLSANTDGVSANGKTCTEIQKNVLELADLNNQKIARLCRMLAEAGRITGASVKQKKLWSIA